ncbi:MAG TPA: integrin alpha, partial [Planctomycetota bacterium]|nr:integrin alpha [Planctomycetota bacterium]
MNVRLCTIVAAGLVLVAAPAGRAQISAFDWAFEYTPFQGQAALQLDTVHISGPNNHDELLAPDVSAWVSTTAAVDAHVSVTAEFVNHDFELLFDAPVAFVGGQIHFPATGGSYPTGTYVLEFDVAAGQTFGFGVWSADASSGPGVADFHDLLFTPDTWLDVGQALDPRAGAAVPPPPGMPDFGSALGALGDLDGDARPDFAVGAPATGHVLAISGADGSTLLDIAGPPGFGAVLSGAGDVDGD